MKSFKESWLDSASKKNSTLCAGVDPPSYLMGRGEKGLPLGTNKRDWVLKYIEAVSPYCAAFKPNVRYFGFEGDNELLKEMGALARDKGMVFIQDSKEADIGETNDGGIFTAALRGAHAVTLAPFAGNMEEASKQAKGRKIGLITMGIMSSPEYKFVKNMLVEVPAGGEGFRPFELQKIGDETYTKFYIKQIVEANKFGVDGIVLGAPSSKNHITEGEIETISAYYPNGLILVPGIGAQGGEVTLLAKHFSLEKIIANVGRALMFPKGANSTPEDQAAEAKMYMNMLNELRKAA